MNEITVNTDSNAAIAMVRELREMGYTQELDFEFYYTPKSHMYVNGKLKVIPCSATFSFYNEHLSTYFALKFC